MAQFVTHQITAGDDRFAFGHHGGPTRSQHPLLVQRLQLHRELLLPDQRRLQRFFRE